MRQLAIDGGQPLFPAGPPEWPLLEDAPRSFSDHSWGKYDGPHTATLVEQLSEIHGGAKVYPCCSGTFAVELALRSLKIGLGDEVIVAAYDFAGNFRAIEAVGASPVLIDIVPGKWHVDLGGLIDAVTSETKAVIVSHLHGALAPMKQLMAIAERHGLAVVEDACQATGAKIDGRTAGTWGHAGLLSFGGSKLLTCGRGGALLSHDEQVIQRAKVFCERGNHAFPLSELQAAALVPQVTKLQSRNARRAQAVRRLTTIELPAGLQWVATPGSEEEPAYFKVGILVAGESNEDAEQRRDKLAAALQAEGVAIDAGFRGFTRRSRSRCRRVGDLPFAEQAVAGTLVLHHPILLRPADDIDRLAKAISDVARQVLNSDESK